MLSGEPGLDLVSGEPGGDLGEAGLWGVFGPSPEKGGAVTNSSNCSGDILPSSLGDFGLSGDFASLEVAGIDVSGEFISEWASLK